MNGIKEIRSISDVFGSELHRISRVLWVRHLQLLWAAAPVTVVEFRDAPSSNAVNGELAKALDQFALPFPPEINSLLVDNVDLQITIHTYVLSFPTPTIGVLERQSKSQQFIRILDA